jgi:MraZ protein
MAYLGRSTHTLDDKGRLILPKRFLDEVAPKDQRYTLTAGFEGCLWLLDRPGWEKVAARVGQDFMGTKHQRQMRRLFLGHAETVKPDRTNRIVIVEALRSYADIGESSEVVLAGTGQTIEIWSKSRWESALAEAASSYEFSDNHLFGPTAAEQP